MSSAERPDGTAVAEPIDAWRTWNLAVVRGALSLLPVGDHRRAWSARESVRARCGRHRTHRAPVPECTCGLHGSKGVSLLQRTRGPTVLGRTALWGRVIEHQQGYRAEFAYPQRVRLLCPVCFWQRGLDGSPPSIAAVPRSGLVVPLCDEHLRTSEGCGYEIRQVRTAWAVEAELLSTYAVDLLAV